MGIEGILVGQIQGEDIGCLSFGYANHQTTYLKNFSLPSGYCVVSHTNAVCVFSNIEAYHLISAADRDSDSLVDASNARPQKAYWS